MHLYHFGLILSSTIDRAGIPVSLVVGVMSLHDNLPLTTCFIALCAVAGTLGDMVMYGIGYYMRLHYGSEKTIFQRVSLVGKLTHICRFVDTRPVLWLVLGRAFQIVNQWIPMAAALRGYPVAYVFLWSALGNALWMATFGVAGLFIGQARETWGTPLGIAMGVVGLIIISVSLRMLDRRSTDGAAPVRRRPAKGSDRCAGGADGQASPGPSTSAL